MNTEGFYVDGHIRGCEYNDLASKISRWDNKSLRPDSFVKFRHVFSSERIFQLLEELYEIYDNWSYQLSTIIAEVNILFFFNKFLHEIFLSSYNIEIMLYL